MQFEFSQETLQHVVSRIAGHEYIEVIAKEMGVATSTLTKHVLAHTGAKRITDLRKGPHITPLARQAKALAEKGKSLQVIADHFKVSRQAVSMWLKRAGFDKTMINEKVVEEKKQQAAELLIEVKDPNVVSEKLGIPKVLAKSLARQLNIKKTSPPCAPKYRELHKKVVERLQEGDSCRSLAQEYDIPYQTVFNWAKRMGIPQNCQHRKTSTNKNKTVAPAVS